MLLVFTEHPRSLNQSCSVLVVCYSSRRHRLPCHAEHNQRWPKHACPSSSIQVIFHTWNPETRPIIWGLDTDRYKSEFGNLSLLLKVQCLFLQFEIISEVICSVAMILEYQWRMLPTRNSANMCIRSFIHEEYPNDTFSILLCPLLCSLLLAFTPLSSLMQEFDFF